MKIMLKLKKGIQTQPYQNIKIKSILSDLVLKTKIWSRDRDQHEKDIETILAQSTISVWNDTVHVETNKWSWLLSLSLADPTPTWTQYRDRDSSIDHVSIKLLIYILRPSYFVCPLFYFGMSQIIVMFLKIRIINLLMFLLYPYLLMFLLYPYLLMFLLII